MTIAQLPAGARRWRFAAQEARRIEFVDRSAVGERRHILSNWIQNKNRTEGSLSKVRPLPRGGRAEFGEGLGPKNDSQNANRFGFFKPAPLARV